MWRVDLKKICVDQLITFENSLKASSHLEWVLLFVKPMSRTIASSSFIPVRVSYNIYIEFHIQIPTHKSFTCGKIRLCFPNSTRQMISEPKASKLGSYHHIYFWTKLLEEQTYWTQLYHTDAMVGGDCEALYLYRLSECM